VSYKLTRKAEADLAALIDFSLKRFGSDTALRHLDKLERSMEALDRGDFEGPSSPSPRAHARFAGGRYRPTGSITSASPASCECSASITALANALTNIEVPGGRRRRREVIEP
jgi:hypothetical protein